MKVDKGDYQTLLGKLSELDALLDHLREQQTTMDTATPEKPQSLTENVEKPERVGGLDHDFFHKCFW